jgi:hypothetical protein
VAYNRTFYSIMQKKYHCNCQAKCKGNSRQVSRTTYWRHQPYRDLDPQFLGRLQSLFNRNPITRGAPSTASEGSGSSSGAAMPSSSVATSSVPRAEQTHRPADDSHREGSSVRVFWHIYLATLMYESRILSLSWISQRYWFTSDLRVSLMSLCLGRLTIRRAIGTISRVPPPDPIDIGDSRL